MSKETTIETTIETEETPTPEPTDVDVTIIQPTPQQPSSEPSSGLSGDRVVELLQSAAAQQAQTFDQMINTYRERMDSLFDRIETLANNLEVTNAAQQASLSDQDERLDRLDQAILAVANIEYLIKLATED